MSKEVKGFIGFVKPYKQDHYCWINGEDFSSGWYPDRGIKHFCKYSCDFDDEDHYIVIPGELL